MPARAVGAALLVSALWGGNAVSVKLGLGGIPPLALAGVRFLLGGAVVAVWARATEVSLRLDPGELGRLARLAVLFVVQIGLLNLGVRFTTAGRASLFLATYPLFTGILAHVFLPGDVLDARKITGMALAFAGVAVLFAEGFLADTGSLLGDLLSLSSGALLGARVVYTKRLTGGMHPGRLLLWQALFAVPTFFLLSLAFEPVAAVRVSVPVVAAVLYQGLVVAGFCFIVQVSLIRHYDASRVSAFGFTTPIFGVLAAAALLGEALTAGLLVSMVLVGAGLVLVNRTGR